jgi:outer membrane protein OmpA-like peptidoglycan-associated protein
MKASTLSTALVVLNSLLSNNAIVAQDRMVKTHRFYFDTDVSSQLRGNSTYNFTDADDAWLNGTIKHIRLVGYTDCQGDEAYNLRLSLHRAQTIANAFLQLGVVDADFPFEIVGAGELPCITKDPSGDAENRRVDLIMTYEVVAKETPDEMTQQIEERGRVELTGVNFQPGRHLLLPSSIEPLDQLLKTMKTHPQLKIELQGHICCQPYPGDGQDNDTGLSNLSEARAKTVYEYLIQQGIGADRLKYRGMGNYFPKVSPEVTEADRIANRRVEAVVWE